MPQTTRMIRIIHAMPPAAQPAIISAKKKELKFSYGLPKASSWCNNIYHPGIVPNLCTLFSFIEY